MPLVHQGPHLGAELAARAHRGAQHVARGDVRDPVARREQRALGALAGALLAEDDDEADAHDGYLRNPS